MQALNLHENQDKTRETVQKRKDFDSFKGIIIERKEGGITHKMKIARWKEMNPGSISVPTHEILNTNCPGDIGWSDSDSELRYDPGRPFMVRRKAFYPSRHLLNATCEGDFVYIYSDGSARGKGQEYGIRLEKRDLRDFRQVWDGVVVISDVGIPVRDKMFKVQSVQWSEDTATLELVNEDSGQILVVQVPLQNK